jgi:hypothetical protein
MKEHVKKPPGYHKPQWDVLTFTWKVPLPPAFQEEDETYAEVPQ